MSAARPDTNREDRGGSEVVPIRPELERGRRLTDVGNAERFAIQHGADVRYCHQFQQWYEWDGKRWTADGTGAIVRRAKATVKGLYLEAAAQSDSAERARAAQHAVTSERDARIRAMIALAQSEPGIPVEPTQFDADPWLFNVGNGTIDLRTAQLREHRRDDLITKLSAIDYDPEAPCHRWERFLWRVTNGDGDRTAFLQRALGYSLSARTDEQCLLMLVGGGSNGKTVFEETARAIGGEYAVKADFATFLHHSSDSPRHDLARLYGARLVTASEVNEGKRLDEAVVKDVTGSGTIAARRLYAESFEFAPTFKVWLSTNHKPIIRGTDFGIWRRIRLVPFDVTIPAEERDPRLLDALRAELPGILAWAVAGALLWARHGLGMTSAVAAATAEYRDEMDILGAFLAECCELGADCAERAQSLFDAYKRWTSRGGEYQLTQTAFGRRLSERGHPADKRGRNKEVWRLGLRLKIEERGQFADSSEPFQTSPSSRSHVEEAEKPSATVRNCPQDELAFAENGRGTP